MTSYGTIRKYNYLLTCKKLPLFSPRQTRDYCSSDNENNNNEKRHLLPVNAFVDLYFKIHCFKLLFINIILLASKQTIKRTQKNTKEHKRTQKNTKEHKRTQYNTKEHKRTQKNTIQHKRTQKNTKEHKRTQNNTIQHKSILITINCKFHYYIIPTGS